MFLRPQFSIKPFYFTKQRSFQLSNFIQCVDPVDDGHVGSGGNFSGEGGGGVPRNAAPVNL